MRLVSRENEPTALIVMAGLPGVGKSAVADALGRALSAAILAVDVIESAILRAGVGSDQPSGLAAYVVAEAIGARLLSQRQWVIIDAVNAVEPARQQWRTLARRHGVPLRIIEVICTDERLHRRRLEQRQRDLPHVSEPSWEDVVRRRAEYAAWAEERLVLDTATPLDRQVARALAYGIESPIGLA